MLAALVARLIDLQSIRIEDALPWRTSSYLMTLKFRPERNYLERLQLLSSLERFVHNNFYQSTEMSAKDTDESKGVTATEHLERTISNDAVLKVAEHADLEAIEETTPGRFVWLCACATAIGGMLFGYDVRNLPCTTMLLFHSLYNPRPEPCDGFLLTHLVTDWCYLRCAGRDRVRPGQQAPRQL